jgi:hypothetical protein
MFLGTRKMRFFGDEFGFILTRRDMWTRGRWMDFLFLPHNEHWSTLPVIVYSATIKVFGLASYLPYLGVLWAIHVTGVVVFRILAVRLGASEWLATLAAAVFLVLGSGAENLVWGFQIGFIGSVTLGLLLLLLADSPTSPGWFGSVVAIGCLMTSAVSLVMITVACVVVALRREWLRLGYFAVVPGLAFVGWYVKWGQRAEGPPIRPVPSAMPGYVFRGTTSAIDGVLQLRGVGPFVVLILFLLAARLWPTSSQNALALAALIAPVAVYGLNSVGRASLGIEQSLASRYVYVCAPFVLLAGIAAVHTFARDGAREVFACIALTWAVIGNGAEFFRFAAERSKVSGPAWHQILGAAAVPSLYAERSTIQVEPTYSPNVSMFGLPDMVALGLPLSEALPQDLADAMGRFGLRKPTTEKPNAAVVELVGNDALTTVTTTSNSCWFLSSPPGPANFRIRVKETGRLRLIPQGDVDAVVNARTDGGLDGTSKTLQLRGPVVFEAIAIPGDFIIKASNHMTVCVGESGG